MNFQNFIPISILNTMTNYSFTKKIKVSAAAFLMVVFSGNASAAAGIAVSQGNTDITSDVTVTDFGEIDLGLTPSGTVTRDFSISETDADTLNLSIANGTRFSVMMLTGDGSIENDGAAQTFRVTFNPGGIVGSFDETLNITNNSGTNPFKIKVQGSSVGPDINVTGVVDNGSSSMTTVDLGTATVTSTKTFTINNTGGGTLMITGVTGATADFAVGALSAGQIGGLETATFQVTFQPTSAGPKSTTLTIASNSPSPEDSYTISLSAVATSPAITLEAPEGTPVTPSNAAVFEGVLTGTTKNLDFKITNSGTSNLNLSSVSKTGDQFAIKSQPAGTVLPGESSVFTMQFTPSGTGPVSGTLTIPSNVPGTSNYVVDMEGSGITLNNQDAFGYTMAQAAPAASGSFLSASSDDVFQPAGLLGDDQFLAVDLGFPFFFYEKSYTQCFISTNGLISFGSGSSTYNPSDIPSTGTPNNIIAPFWTDLATGSSFGNGSGKILYATRGVAPHRVFVVKWENAKEFRNTTKEVTFQALLYESSNTIEFQYKDISPDFGTSRNVGIGIESRNYGTTQPQPAADVVGLRYAYGVINDAKSEFGTSVKAFPSSVRFTRPVIFSVESRYEQPTGADPSVTVLRNTPNLGAPDTAISPVIGSTYRTPYGTDQRFEAPEVIYMNRKFEKLAMAGDLDDADALASNPEGDDVAWYRLVNDGYAIDGQTVQGTHTFFSTTLTHDVTVIWRWRLEHAVIFESATGGGGFGNPTPEIGREWYEAGEQVRASIDSSVTDTGAGLRFRSKGYSLFDKNGVSVPSTIVFDEDSERQAIVPFTMVEPRRVKWEWAGQVRYRFDAAREGVGGGFVSDAAFVRVYDETGTVLDPSLGDNGVYWSTGQDRDVWVDSGSAGSATPGRRVEVGVFHRTLDRCFTVGNFNTPPGGDLGAIGISVSGLSDQYVDDVLGNSRLARVYTVTNAENPTEIHWNYKNTVFRAIVPLGQSFDPNNADQQLVPQLCDGGVLSPDGPGDAVTILGPVDGSLNKTPDPLQWDIPGERLFPLHPGSYQVSWTDRNTDRVYKIEIVSGFPDDPAELATPEETEDGLRKRTVTLTNCNFTLGLDVISCSSTAELTVGMDVSGWGIPPGANVVSVTTGSTFVISSPTDRDGANLTLGAGQFQNQVIMEGIEVAEGYPAAAVGAHYRHLFTTVDRQPPTKLDLNQVDQWKFQNMTYAEDSTGASVVNTVDVVPFTVTGSGRSVLLYSYRPNPDEIADGDLGNENLAVRVVRSEPVVSVVRDDSSYVLGRRGLTLGHGPVANEGAVAMVQQAVGAPTEVDPGDHYVVDFWLNAKGLTDPQSYGLLNCSTTEGATNVVCASTEKLVVGMTVSGPFLAPETTVQSITDATSFQLSEPASGDGGGLVLTAVDSRPVTVFSAGENGLKIVLNSQAETVSASLGGETLMVTHGLSRSGAIWRHLAVHLFEDRFFNSPVTIMDFYLDGIRVEKGAQTHLLSGATPIEVGSGVSANSLNFGSGVDPENGIQIDQFRLFKLTERNNNNPYLTLGEVRQLRVSGDLLLRGSSPELDFGFEADPVDSLFENENTAVKVGIEATSDDLDVLLAGIWARLDIEEVATRLDSTLDNANFGGTGYVLNEISNYNAELYDRAAEVGFWGPIFPVNDGQLFTDSDRLLEIAYYENPFLTDPERNPNVSWPYISARIDSVVFPTFGPHREKAIYIASRVGSEGIDKKGRLQKIYDLESYADLKLYNQSDSGLPGYNPNEEHALIAPSGRAALKIKNLGADVPNNPPLAAFALQRNINEKNVPFTSKPWVLVQVSNLETGEPEMAAYEVFETRGGEVMFPRPPDVSDDVNGIRGVDRVAGLAYESAANPEDRFLTTDPEEIYDFSYQFTYPVFAGDLLIPPYPLNVVIGNVPMKDSRGGNMMINGRSQATYWADVNGNSWVISGNGRFFQQFFYPKRPDFHLSGVANGTPVPWVPVEENSNRDFVGDPDVLSPGRVIYSSFWRADYPKLKRGETLTFQGGEYFAETPGANGLPALVAMKAAEIVYDDSTPDMVISDDADLDSYSARIIRPLDRLESRFSVADMSSAGFSPAAESIFVVAERWYFKALPGSLQRRFYFDSLAQKLVFRGYLNDKDSGDPDLTSGPDPLNVLEPNIITSNDLALLLELGTGPWEAAIQEIYLLSQNPMLIRDEGLAGYPTKTGKYLAGMKESPILTNRIGQNDTLFTLRGLELDLEKVEEQAALDEEALTQWNSGLSYGNWNLTGTPPDDFSYHGGLSSYGSEAMNAYRIAAAESGLTSAELDEEISTLRAQIVRLENQAQSNFAHLDSFGVGAALVCNPNLLTASVDEPRYITIAENNRSELDGAAISLHIIEIIPDRYRGAIKVIEGADAFSEKVTLQHNGEFGANTDNLYYEWWIRDAAPLNLALQSEIQSLSTDDPDPDWQQYLPEPKTPKTPAELLALGVTAEAGKHLGLHTIVFEGRPDVTLADKLVMVRYRHKFEEGWNLVPFEVADSAVAWKPGELPVKSNAPFQWAGAANSPQLQADGSKRYIPQLVMGWVKRVLDRINPYEARYRDFFSNETPATYSSQIQIAGAPFAGKVALNSDKNVIENTGLIELYETVLARARELSIDNSSNGNASDGIQQALLLAATRLSTLYDLLAREAYSDAQDSTITVSDADDLSSVASFTHAFQNMEADLQHEELALLRGTDFLKSYPVYNRIFWNYSKGLGEAAYNVNYNIYDANTDGFINEDDARILYPQGHGDAWGHFSSALGMSYTLLQSPGFSWKSRSELYSLMQNVLEVDFLDEKTFAKIAAGKARAGRDIVKGTYRLAYTQDPDGQWQGYTDAADPARAWGVSEWAHRAGQGAYFDFLVANALLPESADLDPDSPIEDPENLDLIERSAAEAEIGEIAGGLHEIQVAMDEANGGVNPLGFDSDALVFDLNMEFYENASGGDRRSHFEQISIRAAAAGNNALATLSYATKAENKLRQIAGDTNSLIAEALSQDIDYRNRLIEIFGRPYDGTIGFGKAYPEGYEGPDTQLFAYLDRTKISDIVPSGDGPSGTVTFSSVNDNIPGISDNSVLNGLYKDLWGESDGSAKLQDALETLIGDNLYLFEPSDSSDLTAPYDTASKYAFVAPDTWGGRTSYGRLQVALEQMLLDEIELDTALIDYIGFLQDWEAKAQRLKSELDIYEKTEGTTDTIEQIRISINAVILAADTAIGIAQAVYDVIEGISSTAAIAAPTAVGFSVDVGAIARAIGLASESAAGGTFNAIKNAKEIVQKIVEFGRDEGIAQHERDFTRADKISAIEAHLEELVNLSGADQPKRNAIALAIQNLEIHRQEYFTAQAEGFRLLREREAFNKILAAKVQTNRYNDMIFRLTRNEAMTKYQTAFNHAARYTWLAARAYDYETSLDPGDPASSSSLLDQIVKERQLGLWVDGEPRAGQGGLAEVLSLMNGNFEVLKGQLGINNPQPEFEKMSLRSELFRIGPPASDGGVAASDDRWKDALKARIVPDLTQMPEFVRHCRPFSTEDEGAQPGIVIRFSSHITNGQNFFGNVLTTGDHAYSTANFANKIRGFGVWLENYNEAGLSTTPRAFLVPIGNDYLRTSSSGDSSTRVWSIMEQRIPTPFVINPGNISEPGYVPTLNGVDGGFGQLRRHGDFRVYHDEGDDDASDDELQLTTRLIGRSVWNSDWMLIIPGAGLDADPLNGLNKLSETIEDIRLQFSTYSHQGQ